MEPVRYVLLDNNLVDPGGHSYAMARALLASDARVEVWAHSRTSIEDPRVRRVFSRSLADRRSAFPENDGSLAFKLGWLKRVVRSNFLYYRDLKRCHRGEDAIWIANNGDMRTFLAILWFAASHRSQLDIAVYFHTPPSRTLRLAGRLARLLALRNVSVALPHARLAESYGSILALRCSVVGYPLRLLDSTAQPASERPPSVGLALGAPRLDKGFDVLVEAIALLRDELNSGDLQMMVQCDAGSADGDIGQSLNTLKALEGSLIGLHLIDRVLSDASYQALLDSAHFVVLPYRVRSYRQRISSVLLEGLAAGKPAIVTAGSLLEDTVNEFGGGVAVEDGDSGSLATAIRQLVDDYGRYAATASSSREQWLRHCDPSAFLGRVADLTRS